MYKVFYDYYGAGYEYVVPSGSNLEKQLDAVYPPAPYYDEGIEDPATFIEQGTYFKDSELDIKIRSAVYDYLKDQSFYNGGKQSHMVVCKDDELGFYIVSSFYTPEEFAQIIESIRTKNK